MSTYSVKLLSHGDNKIAVIKVVREVTRLGIKEAKELVEGRGIVAEDQSRRAAEKIQDKLAAVGAKSSIEPKSAPEPAPVPQPAPTEDQETGVLRVRLISLGDNKMAVIQEVRRITGLGIKEAKDLVDGLGVVAENLSLSAARKIRQQLAAADAESRIESMGEPQRDPVPPPEPTEDQDGGGYDVRFTSFGGNKIAVIKKVREITGFGLSEAKAVVDELSTVAANVSLKEAGRIQEKLASAGAKSVIEPTSTLQPEPEPVEPEPELPTKPAYALSGCITNRQGQPLKGLTVSAFGQNSNSADDALGEATTNARGRYTIRFAEAQFRPGGEESSGPDVYIRVFDGDALLGGSPVRRNSEKRIAIDFEVDDVAADPIIKGVIEGRIILEHGLPAENLALRFYRHGFAGTASLLGETITGEHGRYSLPYTLRGSVAGLEVRALGARGREIPLSNPLYDLGGTARTEINLVAPAALQPMAAEYRRLTEDLIPRLGDMKKLAEAREDGERRDLTVLNRATGWDARLIALAAMCERLGADPDVGLLSEAVYGLLRAGLPSDKLLLAQVGPEVAEQALKKAQEAGIIGLDDQQLGQVKEQFADFADRVRLQVPVPGSRSTYGQLLRASGLSETAQRSFASVYLNHGGDSEGLWQRAREVGLDEPQIQKLQLQGKLAFLAGNSEVMTSRLMQNQIEDPAQLVEQDFHRADAWASEVFEQAGIPADLRNDLSQADRAKLADLIPAAYNAVEVEDRLRAYTEDMARKVRLSYPTQVVGRLLETDDRFRLQAAHDATVMLLKSAVGQGFRLGETPAAAFLKAHPEVTAEIEDAALPTTEQQLQALQRVYQITPGYEAMPVLMSLGMTSAYDVIAYPEAEFDALYVGRYVDMYGKLPTQAEIRLIRKKSEQVSSVTYNLFTIARKLESEPPIAGLSAPVEVRESVRNELIRRFPTMESLFGSMDYCECEHCRSVLSPAAYLVDLLQFIDPEPGLWGNFLAHWKAKHSNQDYPHRDVDGKAMKPYDVLVERRPDLPHIPLTCENTHTALPYIDIVNEILEYYVAHDRLEPDATHDTGGATTAELLAEPQNVVREAYDNLLEARYPLNLPFDLWLETVRRFCSYGETPLDRLLETFRPGDELFSPAQPFDRAAIFIESLGLSPAERVVFTDPDPLSGWHELYGFTSAAEATTEAVDADTGQRIDLTSAKALSRRLGVTYKEIAEIVQTGFVNPKLETWGLLYKLGVSIEDVRFYLDHRALITEDPATLGPEDRKRRLEAKAFADELQRLGDEYAVAAANLEAAVQAIPLGDILVLADPDTGCNFDLTTLRYADGADADSIAFLRINLFVRLWRKLGWSIEETDRALRTFVPRSTPFDDDSANLAKQPLETALIYLAHLEELDGKLGVGKHSRLKLLTLWSDIATTGKQPLYAQLFLTRSVLKSAPVFDHPFREYLSDPDVALADHVLSVQGALGLAADDVRRILEDAGESLGTARLSLGVVSLLYRYGLLAKALMLSVRELITLKQLSGLEPFRPLHADPLETIEQDHPFSQTLRFVEIASEVNESGLKIDDLDYLLRHRFDQTGKYRLDRDAMLRLLKTLAEGIRAIRSEHATPDDPATIGGEALRQKLGQALPVDVAERLLLMLDGTAEFTATRAGVAPAEQLDPAAFEGEPAIRQFDYNEARQEQRLTFRGVLFDPEKLALNDLLPSPILGDLLVDVQRQARQFFEKHLQRQAPGMQPTYGFLNAADFDLLFDRALTAGETEENRLRRQRARLAEAFLPYLQQRLIRQSVVQTLTAHTGADPVLVESLATDERLLAMPGGGPLLTSLAATGERGVSAEFFDSDDLSGAPQAAAAVVRSADVALKDTHDTDAAGSARFEGYLEVPVPGAYRFFVELDRQGAEAELRFDHLPDPVFLCGVAAADGTTLGEQPGEFLELRPGVLYRFSLELKQLNGSGARLQVQGETLPKDELSRLPLYPANAMDEAEHALILLSKALQLVQALGLSEREMRYLLTDGAHAFDHLDFKTLPRRDAQHALDAIAASKMEADSTLSKEQAASQARNENPDLAGQADQVTPHFKQVSRLMAYARLKRDLAGGTDDLIGIFEADETDQPDKRNKKVYPLIATLTRRDETTVRAVANALFARDSDFASDKPFFTREKPLQRLWEALQVVERFGVPVTSLLEWTRIVSADVTPGQRFETARDLKEAIKARFEPEAWQRVAQPIFDRLRQHQRDALVSHVMHQHGFDRVEQLYEYFLIDPDMEPVVQTSRIRLAIGAVQLFIQRCLLNLEVKVHPSTINSRHWEWMKRYRVWEANRKIFLYPENWLEPEFRDDKTHLFAELEGALLQGDVSSDLVEDAFLNYLKKLDELARLDIVAMHIEDDPDPARRTLHVFGRTYSQPHKYYYRRYAHEMWTPWEAVTAAIEGDHLAPVIWRDRLYLFWITFLDKPVENPQPSGAAAEMRLKDLTLKNAVGGLEGMATEKLVETQLHWSEYLKGEWSTPEFGPFMLVTTWVEKWRKLANGIVVRDYENVPLRLPSSFNVSDVFVHVETHAESGDETGVSIHLQCPDYFSFGFYLAGRNSAPERGPYSAAPRNPYGADVPEVTRYSGRGAFEVTYKRQIRTEQGKPPTVVPKTSNILSRDGAFTLLPCNNDLTALGIPEISTGAAAAAIKEAIGNGLYEIASLVKPVFYQDNRHTLFIEPEVKEETIGKWQGWIPQPDPAWNFPDWLSNDYVIPEKPWRWQTPDLRDPLLGLEIDREALINPSPHRDWLTNPGTVIKFDDVLIGPVGQPGLQILPGRIAGTVAKGAVTHVNPGSGLAASDTVVLADSRAFKESGLVQVAGGLNVVGSAGFNAVLRKNFNDFNRAGLSAGVSAAETTIR
jgi:ribosomal protein L7/L12